MPRPSTLSDANSRRKECVFEAEYRDLYGTYRDELSSDSIRRLVPLWRKRLQIIDSTTITLFSNLIFKGVDRHPKTGKKKGGIKVHANIHANEGVPSDIRFTSAATNDSFMLRPSNYASGEIVALDRAYIDYATFEELSQREVTYVTKMKKKLVYQTESDIMYMHPEGLMEYRVPACLFLRIERKWNAFDIGIFHSSLHNKWALSHSTTALMMRMSLRGLSSSPVFAFSIFETTFIPSVTSPKTV